MTGPATSSDRLEFRYSPQKQLGLIIIECVVVAFCWYVAATTADPVYRVAAWIGVGFFILCGIIAVKRMVVGGVPFVFDRAGIAFPGGTFGIVPWTEIKSYAVVTVRGNEFLALTFNDPDRLLSRVSTAKRKWAMTNERLGWGHWSVTFTGLTPGINEAMAFIRDHSLVQPAGG